ncbi:MAG: hypothetical protein H7Y11_12865 [Armatimonadetes bacterium]|nr:hypothetical protein [Anaerolineae bacterium]
MRSIATGGPSPTPLFGAASTAIGAPATIARVDNPNAPRIEFFTTDAESVAPGSDVTLFWSTRNVEGAVIYRLNQNRERTLTYNIPPDGSEGVRVGENERGRVDFVLVVGKGAQAVEQTLSIAILCPVAWFFQPAPQACPSGEAQPTAIITQDFERGRMLYIGERDRVYVLFNDERAPAWIDFANLYDPAIHPERDESFELALARTGLYQPAATLGFVWRGNDTVRNRLGVGVNPEAQFEGTVQRAPTVGADGDDGADSLYITTGTGTVLELLPGGESWRIITPS